MEQTPKKIDAAEKLPQNNPTDMKQAPAAEEAIDRCAAALRRHHFDVATVKTPEEAFEVMRATVEAEQPKLVSFGDSMTMRATGIIEWLRTDDRWTLLDGFDASMPRPERLEIRRQALLCDLFVTGINAVTEQGTLHWLDMVGNRIAPRGIRTPQGDPRGRAQQDHGLARGGRGAHPPYRSSAEHRPAPGIPHAVRQNGRLHGLQLSGPDLQHPHGDVALPPRRAHPGHPDRPGTRFMTHGSHKNW